MTHVDFGTRSRIARQAKRRAERRPYVRLTDEMFAAIPAWLEQGADAALIAEVLGTTKGSLEVQCSQRRISLAAPKVTSRSLRARLGDEVADVLTREARARGQTLVQLVLSIAEATARHNLFRAVLGDNDDDEDPACIGQ